MRAGAVVAGKTLYAGAIRTSAMRGGVGADGAGGWSVGCGIGCFTAGNASTHDVFGAGRTGGGCAGEKRDEKDDAH